MLLDSSEMQLVLIDYQPRLMSAIHEGEAVLAQAQRLAKIAAVLEVPIWGTEQNPERLGELAAPLRGLCRKVLPKMTFSAVAEGLGDWLRPPQRAPQGNARSLPRHLRRDAAGEGEARSPRETILLAGCEAHVCVLQTALELLDEEFDVWVVTDACGSRRLSDRDAAFDRLASAGVELVTTEMVAFEGLRSAEHPQFKAVQSLIR
ncbi:isochorismatase family protein [Tibeticola sp.]|uniref:isochorismatase family protein n=1 Tax=Tibeticola sp. TaxID=2005368 RepID=UPI00258829F2|nr:isochorismatase family protein [Tibeticola sp.]MCI4440884.1 isochorismatase family protein [Tibeticola sp.]